MVFRLIILIVILGPGQLVAGAIDDDESLRADCVVLLHGLGRSAFSMRALENELEAAGYQVVNESYPSREYPVQELAVIAVEEGLARCRSLAGGRAPGRVNFVTHSLGGILVRKYLADRNIPNLGRVVMLGPPNNGSQMADYAREFGLLRPMLPPAVGQLGTSDESVPLQLGRVDFELGVIAGTVNYIAFLPGVPQEASDGTVTVAETMVRGMSDFIELPASHTFMMQHDEVIEQTLFFLANGAFRRSSPPFISP